MYSGTHYQLLSGYNQWMNEKLYAAAAKLSDEDRKRDLRAFFKSIHGTFEHLLWVDQTWLKRFAGEPISRPSGEGFAFPDFQELWAARRACDEQIERWALSLSAEFLASAFTFKSVLFERTFTRLGAVIATHFFNHQTHHRGQITTLLLQLGVDPGATDVILLPAVLESSEP